MIKLENVSTSCLIKSLSCDYRNVLYHSAYEFLIKNKIINYQQLKNMLENDDLGFDTSFFKDILEVIENNLVQANMLGYEPNLYPCNDYNNSNIDRKTIEITDKTNKGNILLFDSPALTRTRKAISISSFSIYELKILLGHISLAKLSRLGENALVSFVPNIGDDSAKKCQKLINFYEEQVIRQSDSNLSPSCDLFGLNKEKKVEIVKEQYKYIVEYIVDNANVCIWGKLSSEQKKILIDSVNSRYYKVGIYTPRDKMIDIISNYTTLSELEKGVVKQKTLDRFIIR